MSEKISLDSSDIEYINILHVVWVLLIVFISYL